MITSDRRPARTRNTTIIVVLGPINAVAATPWVDFRVGEPIRSPPIRGRLGRMSERGLAPEPARLIVSLRRRSGSARNRRAAEPPMPENVLAQRRDSGSPAGPRYRPSPSAARSLTQGAGTSEPAAHRHNFRMSISRAGRSCSSRYSRYGVSTSSIHFMNARTRRDRLLRCATTRDTASARRRKSGMISTSAPLSKYRPIPKSGA